MTVSTLAPRPAIDSRPPAQPWSGLPLATRLVPPDQPTLDLDADAELNQLTRAPISTRSPLTIDVTPSGAAPERESELIEQISTWVPWFAQLLVETVDGRRPPEALGRWLDEWVLAEVSRRLRLQRRVRSRGAAGLPPATLVSLRAQLTHPRVLEVAMHLRRGHRSAAWAFQLIRVGEHWRCAALVFDPWPETTTGGSATR